MKCSLEEDEYESNEYDNKYDRIDYGHEELDIDFENGGSNQFEIIERTSSTSDTLCFFLKFS